MSPRHLLTLDAPVGAEAVSAMLPRVQGALDGSGPAVMLLPTGPAATRQKLVAAAARGAPPPHVALVVPTSGTTGSPRLAMLTADALAASVAATAEVLGGVGSQLLALPTAYVAGAMVLVRSVLGGQELVVMDQSQGFTARAFADAVGALLERQGGRQSRCSLVPTQLTRLLDAGGSATAALRALDTVLLGGAAPPDELVDRAADAGVSVVTTYGMTETCGGCVYDGRPLPGTDVAVDESGRIRLSGPTLFAGYLGRPDLTAQSLDDGWFVTDDLGQLTEKGLLQVLGRADDVIVSGGVNVSPTQVEAALLSHAAVADVVVVPRDDPAWGQAVVAVVEVAGPAVPDLTGLRAHARDRLPTAALPQGLVVVDALPRLASGKPDRQAVRTLVAAVPS